VTVRTENHFNFKEILKPPFFNFQKQINSTAQWLLY